MPDRKPTANEDLEHIKARIIQGIRDRYDAMREKLRRDAQDAEDAERKGERRL